MIVSPSIILLQSHVGGLLALDQEKRPPPFEYIIFLMIKYLMSLDSCCSDDQILVSVIVFGHFLVVLGL